MRKTLSGLVVVAGLMIFGLGQPIQGQETPATRSNYDSKAPAPEDGVQETEIVLLRRSQPEYGKSAYSFRYKTQDKTKHKNYVDIVYAANGFLRINNHGGQANTIADLGDTVGRGFNVKNVKKETWQELQIKPVAGHFYVQNIIADKNRMKVLLYIDSVSKEKVELTAWFEKGKDVWPVSLEGRGEAGTSGMSAGAIKPR